MEIKNLQKEIDRINIIVSKHYNMESDDNKAIKMTLKLGEEYGELCEAILLKEGLQRKEKENGNNFENIKGELADVIITAMTLSRYLNIDIEEILVNKLKIIEDRLIKK